MGARSIKGLKHCWLNLTIWPVALAAALLNLLNFHGYPLLRAEVGIALVGLCFVGLLMGLTQQAAGPRLSFLLTALFTAVTIDLNVEMETAWFFALWAGFAIIGLVAHDALLKVGFGSFGAVLLFQIAIPITGIGDANVDENMAQNHQTLNRPSAERPAIIHLVLDSYLGLDGMALGPDDFSALRREQTAFFIERGFTLYPRAYSRHSRTMNSLPHMFSYGRALPSVHNISAQYAVPDALPYFIDLDKRGYRISAVLPAYFDLCVTQKLTNCRHFQFSALTSMLGTELGAIDRAKLFGFTLLQLTHLPRRVVTATQLSANDLLGTEARWPFDRNELYHLASVRELDRFTEDLSDLRAGEVRFVHLLLPHSPFGLRSDCKVKPEADWLNEHGPGGVDERERAYADQVRCLQRRIGGMLDALDRTHAGREAIVLIHGDHGSRIAPAHPYLGGPRLTRREMLMVYSTFFAIRVPGEEAGEVPGTHALDELLAEFLAQDFRSSPRPVAAPEEVVVMNALGIPKLRWPLPDFEPEPSSPLPK